MFPKVYVMNTESPRLYIHLINCAGEGEEKLTRSREQIQYYSKRGKRKKTSMVCKDKAWISGISTHIVTCLHFTHTHALVYPNN